MNLVGVDDGRFVHDPRLDGAIANNTTINARDDLDREFTLASGIARRL